METIIRPLDGAEQGMYLMQKHLNGCTNVARLVTVEGHCDENQFRSALSVIVKQNPVLNATIVENGQQPMFAKLADDYPLPLTFLNNDSEAHLHASIVKAVNTHFIEGQACWQASVLQSKDQWHILFTAHHCISDGFSGARLIHQLLMLYSGSNSAETEQQHFPPALEDFLPHQFKGFSGAMKTIVYLWDAVIRNARAWPTIRPSTINTSANRTNFVSVTLNAETVKKLKRTAQQRSASMHGLLLAAMTISSKQILATDGTANAGIITSVDLRPRLPDAAGEGMIPRMSSVFQATTIPDERSLLPLAQTLGADVKAQLARGFDFTTLKIAPFQIKRMVEKPGKTAHNLQLANNGVSPIKPAYNTLKIKSVSSFQNFNGMASAIVLLVTTLDDSMHCNFCYVEGQFNRDAVTHMKDRFQALLETV